MKFVFSVFVLVLCVASSSCSIFREVEVVNEDVVLDLSKPYNNVDSNDVYAQVEVLSNKLNINPIHLMILINFETGGTFDPTIKSQVSSGRGLIQVLDRTACGLVDKNGKEIKSSKHLIKVYPTLHEQLEVPNEKNKFGGPVYQYFSKLKPKKDDLRDLIACNFYPFARGKQVTFKKNIGGVNGGLKNIDQYVVLAIQRAKEKGIVDSTY